MLPFTGTPPPPAKDQSRREMPAGRRDGIPQRAAVGGTSCSGFRFRVQLEA